MYIHYVIYTPVIAQCLRSNRYQEYVRTRGNVGQWQRIAKPGVMVGVWRALRCAVAHCHGARLAVAVAGWLAGWLAGLPW